MADLRQHLRQHLVASRIAGEVATSRQDNLRNIRRMLSDAPEYWFGLHRLRDWTYEDVFDVMVRRCGIDPDPGHVEGGDTIGVELLLDQLTRHRDRLAVAAERRERVVLATGHPTGILVMHLQVAAALRAAGCDVLTPDVPWTLPWDNDWGSLTQRRQRHIRWINGVAVLASGGELLHTHLPEPMSALLASLDAPPDLVVADHGWAGAAAEAGIETLGYADCNDPALFVAEEEGKPLVTVPLDDNVPPHLYDPISAFLLAGWSA
ncbi:MAG: phosphatase [Actinobacteria bacterium]|nr:phosphatase [Actinomycetota bacterium]MCA1722447.1 phosphatase [Actinomycetota bacterium]